jgi:pimeloyl-ACP methyl ester carboxylesterase
LQWINYISKELNVNVLAYDYEGYGRSSGEASEYAVQDDAIAAYEYLTQELSIKPENIFLFGRSVGGGPTVHLAKELSEKKEKIGGVILLSAFTSAIGTTLNYKLSRYLPSFLVTDVFDNYSKLKHVDESVPFLFIHGTSDEIVPYHCSVDMHKYLKGFGRPSKLVSLQGGDHNSIVSKSHRKIIEELRAFIAQ